ncbi:F-box/kelch-repeat protein At5g43190 [Beta vulgaris subsp. vulgaris]|uniref:F-box/kelch-repeat protein At5g43190 n=1 Tax=Beta vulgaris subsp. vulgaris TaxID=3555 RepID=UPI0020369DBF|nr:F-box/kelch-repeat protein At5g43190 [Beta vulgaris subsp. vulgaris]
MAKISPDLDPSIWSKLPDELLDYILCFLSLKSILNLRSTCKRFKSLLFNPSFLSKLYPSFSSSSSSPFSSFLLLSHPHFNHHFPLYNSVSATWRESSSSPSLLNPCPSSSSSLLSSSNGLLCFHLQNSSTFLVSNLLSRSSTLIKSPRLSFTFELLTLVSSPNGFKIFVYSSESVFLYDSTIRSWRNFGGFDSILNDNIHQEGVYRDGYLYFITSYPYSIVSFDLEKGVWGYPFAEMPTNELIFARIVISDDCEDGAGGKNKMYVIGGVGGNGISRCLKVWGFGGKNDDNNNWVEVESLPDLMYRKLVSVCYHNYEHIYCFWHNGMICICCYSWPEILYYRVSRRTWHWLPKCPALPNKWSCGFRWFSFVPKLHASI